MDKDEKDVKKNPSPSLSVKKKKDGRYGVDAQDLASSLERKKREVEGIRFTTVRRV